MSATILEAQPSYLGWIFDEFLPGSHILNLTARKGSRVLSDNHQLNTHAQVSGSATPYDTAIEAGLSLAGALGNTPLLAVRSFDRRGIVHHWNPACETRYGIATKDALGRPMNDLLDVEEVSGENLNEAIQQIWQGTLPGLSRELRLKTVGGQTKLAYVTMFPVFRHGQVSDIFCMDLDIAAFKPLKGSVPSDVLRFKTLFERSADAIILLNEDSFLDANPAAMKMFGYTDKSAMVGQHPENLSPPLQPDGRNSRSKAREMISLAHQLGNYRFEWVHRRASNEDFWAEVLLTAISPSEQALLYAVLRDISDRKDVELKMRLNAQAFESSREAILITDSNKQIISINRAFMEITGFSASEALGNSPKMLSSGLHDQDFYRNIWDTVRVLGHWEGEIWDRHRDGRSYPQWMTISAVINAAGVITNYIAVFSDITHRKASEEHTRYIAEHDFLTNLPNRILLLDRATQAIGAAQRNGKQLAILFLDLDRFKNINDSLGHHIGDRLLKQVAQRLEACVRSSDTVSRLGGDEFIILLIDVDNVESVGHIADKVLKEITNTYLVDDYEFDITGSLGISLYPMDGNDMDTLIKNADAAMYHAKERGRNNYQFFSKEMNVRLVERLTMELALRKALDNEEFMLLYQPQVELCSGRITGAEALIRWMHSDFGVVPPGRFIPVTEESGLIIPIGKWVLETACLQAKAWEKAGYPIVMAVNLSSVQFRQKDLLSTIVSALQRANLDPHLLELEITEGIILEGAERTIETMNALVRIGVKLSIDDFGTGYSSLSYLKRFPINKLKIDRSFVRDIDTDAGDAAITRAIIDMARNLNLKVIAEGVETKAHLDFLLAHGCDEYQGYYFAKPILAEEFERMLKIPEGDT
ncbi:bifunctional diguanylate cyclase/phosphodiesterase [Chitinivorax sp. B]|uniref:sensor domain-containing protein n=1 Tax=Chitinivorax sp. B TaxID=2502235 RepID=UPI002017D55F|nr:bifunctional diguanylate cyclase/phosphodiesterase [Chitinivorax sp. B]